MLKTRSLLSTLANQLFGQLAVDTRKEDHRIRIMHNVITSGSICINSTDLLLNINSLIGLSKVIYKLVKQ